MCMAIFYSSHNIMKILTMYHVWPTIFFFKQINKKCYFQASKSSIEKYGISILFYLVYIVITVLNQNGTSQNCVNFYFYTNSKYALTFYERI